MKTTTTRPPKPGQVRRAELCKRARVLAIGHLEDERDAAVSQGDELAASVYTAELRLRTLGAPRIERPVVQEVLEELALLDLLTVENVIASPLETSSHVAFVAHVMLGTDFAFEAKADGHGAMQFGRADARYLARLGGIHAVQARVVELAEWHLCDRNTDGRYYRQEDDGRIFFGIPDVMGEVQVQWDRHPTMVLPYNAWPLIRKLAEVFLDAERVIPSGSIFFAAFLRRHGFVNVTEGGLLPGSGQGSRRTTIAPDTISRASRHRPTFGRKTEVEGSSSVASF